jgi:hypothetical protein
MAGDERGAEGNFDGINGMDGIREGEFWTGLT